MTYAYDEVYLYDAKLELGDFLDYCIMDCKLEPDWVAELFMFSGYDKLFERGNPWIVGGMSGVELAQRILRENAGWEEFPEPSYSFEKSPYYWAGWALAEYQWYSNTRFKDVFRRITLSSIIAMYSIYHEMDITNFIAAINEKTYVGETRLKLIRSRLGLSQSQLAKASGVKLRNIQLYEQKINDIDKASAIILYKLARALNCSMEDLLEEVS